MILTFIIQTLRKKESNVQESQTKSNDETEALHLSHVQLPHSRHWKDKNCDISPNCTGCICTPCCDLVNTVAGKLRIPQFLHRCAYEDEDEDYGDNPCNNETSNGIGPGFEISNGKYAIVHGQERDLG